MEVKSATDDREVKEQPKFEQGQSSTAQEQQSSTVERKDPEQPAIPIDYSKFFEATRGGKLDAMKEFLKSNPEAKLGKALPKTRGVTALLHVLLDENIDIAKWLVSNYSADELAHTTGEGYTALAVLASFNKEGVLGLQEDMVKKNDKLPNIQINHGFLKLPVLITSWKGFKEETEYLYSVTSNETLCPEGQGRCYGSDLLIYCLEKKWFDLAKKILVRFPNILQHPNRENIYPIHGLAKSFSAMEEENMYEKSRNDGALQFLDLVCDKVKSFDEPKLRKCVYEAMIEASKNGIVVFVQDMLFANPKLVEARVERKRMFWYAIENRQEKVYNLIYCFLEKKDTLLATSIPKENVLQFVAESAPTVNRSSVPALQVQKELKWFKEVWSLAKPEYRRYLNKDKLTPSALFSKSHEKLIEAGEKAMKDTAQSCTVVGALIITFMFAAAFTVPGGNDQVKGYPIFWKKALFKIFIICDALSLYSSTTSVLVFLSVLTSRFAEEDFLVRLPRKLMIGLTTLLFSITTMMISFCMALALMFKERLGYILPTTLLAFVPISYFIKSIVPDLWEIYRSTYGPSMFENTGKKLKKTERKTLEKEWP